MKSLKYILMATVCALFTACMDGDWSENDVKSEVPYGNNDITPTNVISIAKLKAMYSSTISSGSLQQVTDDIQIMGRVTGNDAGGNIYNEIALQDSTGAILVCIAEGGLWGYLPVGQQILISLKDLYIGSYGKQAEIGTPYTNKSGSTYVSRMGRLVWNQHFKIIGTADSTAIQPVTYSSSLSIDNDCGKLVTLKNVTLKNADGKAVFAPNDGSVTLTANCANRETSEYGSKVVVRTSTYADFANRVMPTGKLNITGIATRFNTTWQILIRTEKDIEVIK